MEGKERRNWRGRWEGKGKGEEVERGRRWGEGVIFLLPPRPTDPGYGSAFSSNENLTLSCNSSNEVICRVHMSVV